VVLNAELVPSLPPSLMLLNTFASSAALFGCILVLERCVGDLLVGYICPEGDLWPYSF
jgi:hypothetical protein